MLVGSGLFAAKNTVRIGLMHRDITTGCEFKVSRGIYKIYADGQHIGTLKKQQKLHFLSGDQVQLNLNGRLHLASSFKLQGNDYVNHFVLSSRHHQNQAYDDNLEIYAKANRLVLINEVQLENYVSSVVEGEAGYQLPLEFYKLQAILSRTYALKNLARHSDQGFNLCDKVHCQVYHHKCTKEDIYQTTIATNSLVVVDDELNLINTIFHSNCGGQTCNSEDVWNTKLSYLRCVKDTFCLHARSASWKKPMLKSTLYAYLRRQKQFKSTSEQLLPSCQINERTREQRFLSIHLTKIRRDLKLRSTFFCIQEKGDSAIFNGRGYGHGVGLCQQGGIEMARKGFGYVDILKHYYQGIHIINRRALRFFKE